MVGGFSGETRLKYLIPPQELSYYALPEWTPWALTSPSVGNFRRKYEMI